MYRRNAGFNYFELVRVLSLQNHSLMSGTTYNFVIFREHDRARKI